MLKFFKSKILQWVYYECTRKSKRKGAVCKTESWLSEWLTLMVSGAISWHAIYVIK